MDFDLQQAVPVLRRTPAVLDTLLRDLPDEWTRRNEGGTTWSAFDVVGHLIHGERTDWVPRAKMILEFGETRTFDRFATGWPPFNLRPEDLDRRGRHPVFGVVTLRQLLATWVPHDLTHLHQISRVMAHQYRDAAGPWQVYLGVLRCAGHGD